jgi:DNA-directed RNA polymerase specialized sigma24 family protein
MSLFAAIERSFEAFCSVEELDRAIRHWSKDSAALSLVRSPEELIEALDCFRDAEERPSRFGDATLAGICVRARNHSVPVDQEPPITTREDARSSRFSEDAALLILWLFLPQLWGTNFANPGGVLDRDDLEAEMALGLWEAVVSVGGHDVGIGRRLVQAARNGARAAARRSLDHQRRCASLDAAAHIMAHDAGPRSSAQPDHVVDTATRIEIVNELEARLILETRVDGLSLKEMGRALGISEKAAEHRRARAEGRLVAWLSNGSIPPRREVAGRTRLARAHVNPDVPSLGTATGSLSSGSGSHQGGDDNQSPRSPSSIQLHKQLGIGCRGS